MSIIQNIIEKNNKRKYERPRHAIKNLYVGQIVHNTHREFVGFGIWDDYSEIVKPYAVFLKLNDYEFIHVKSGQKLKLIGYNDVGDYAVRNPKPWQELYVVEMREDGDIQNTKLSKSFIDELEKEANIKMVDGKTKKQELFGL